MKITMEDRESFAHWFLITCASSEDDTHSNPDSKFNQMIKHPDWNSKDVNMSVVINGFEFTNLEDLFKRVEQHIQKKVDERIAEQNLDTLKLDAIRNIIHARSIEDLEYV